jgi:predicted phage-related endonuclease
MIFRLSIFDAFFSFRTMNRNTIESKHDSLRRHYRRQIRHQNQVISCASRSGVVFHVHPAICIVVVSPAAHSRADSAANTQPNAKADAKANAETKYLRAHSYTTHNLCSGCFTNFYDCALSQRHCLRRCHQLQNRRKHTALLINQYSIL